MSVSRMYRYRLYPTPNQSQILNKMLFDCCGLYNYLLELRISSYQNDNKSLGKFDLNKQITILKKDHPFLKDIHSQVLQNLSDKLQKAFESFFRRVKAGETPGFPRFKSLKRYQSLTYPQSGFKLLSDKKLHLSKIGDVEIILHRKPKGEVKTLTIKKTPTGKWFATFSCEVDFEQNVHTYKDKEVGIDVGLKTFATLNDGTKIGNPRFLVSSEDRLAFLQRKLSKKKKASSNRGTAKLKVAKLHEKIANQRHDFLHKLSKFFVKRYGKIAIEDLNIIGMVKHPYLAKSINDASWGTFTRNLTYKAEEAGCEIVKVNPRGTSVKCSQCGTGVPKTLAMRWHRCPSCGLEIDRDVNASRNILKALNGKTLTTAGTAVSQACGDGSSLLGEILEVSPSGKQEATLLVGR